MPTEDHPMGYAKFEGIIPDGEYGAGPVIVWDRGTWNNLTVQDDRPLAPEQALEQGHLKFQLQGEKLRGGWALTRVGSQDSRERWLLVKLNDAEANPQRNVVEDEPDSVFSCKSLADLAET